MKEDIVSLMKRIVTDHNISKIKNNYQTPIAKDKVITCDKNCEGRFNFYIRNNKFCTIYNISEEGDITDRKGKEISNKKSLIKIYKTVIKIADNLYPWY